MSVSACSGQNRPFDAGRPACRTLDGAGNPGDAVRPTSGLEQDNITTTGSLDCGWPRNQRLPQRQGQLPRRTTPADLGVPDEALAHVRAGFRRDSRKRGQTSCSAAGFGSLLTNRARQTGRLHAHGRNRRRHVLLRDRRPAQHTFKTGLQFERIGNDVADIEQQPKRRVRLGPVAARR